MLPVTRSVMNICTKFVVNISRKFAKSPSVRELEAGRDGRTDGRNAVEKCLFNCASFQHVIGYLTSNVSTRNF